MLLKKLMIENFRSYKNQVINFPKGSILLSGDIGSGKTTVLLAIEFALFGLQPSQKGNSLLRNGVEEAKVILNLEIDNKDIVIERTLKRKKNSINQDYVSIIIDNERFEESVSEIKSKILNLLNYPPEFIKKTNLLYKFTVYTPQEEMKQIILESKDTRLNTLRHVFGIDKYKRIEENTKILSTKLREKIRINEALFNNLEESKKNLTEKENLLIKSKEDFIESEKNYITSFKDREIKEKDIDEIKKKINEKDKLISEKEKIILLINEKNIQVLKHSNDIKLVKQQIEELEKLKFSDDEYNSVKQRINVQKNKYDGLNSNYIDITGKIKSLENKKDEANSLIKKIYALENCPTCLQHVSEEYKSNISKNATNEIDLVNNHLKEYTKNKIDLVENINAIKDLINNFENKKNEMDLIKIKIDNLKDKENRIEDMERHIKSVNKDILMLKQQIEIIDEEIKNYDKYDLIFDEKYKGLQNSKEIESKAAIKKAEINKDITFLENQIKEIKEKITRKEDLKNQTDKLKNLDNWISEKFLEIVLFTEKQVMATLKHEFSNLFSTWFSNLVSDNIIARLDEEFSPVIEQNGFELDYSFLSGGERTAIALAYRLALNQIINSLLSNIKTSNLVILDEPTDGFSSQQLEKMREVLEQLDIEQLIIVSHEQKMEDFVDNIIKISKNEGVSEAK